MKAKFIRAFAVAAVATSATLPARAAYYDWKGKSGETSYFDDLSCWGGNPGTDISKDAHYFGYGVATVLNTTITSRKSQSLSGVMNVKKGTCSFVAEAAGYGINSSANIEIGSATATAEFKSGTYKFVQTQIGKASGQTGTLKVSGGTFTSSDYFAVGQAGTGYLEIDGGTVKATGKYMRIGAGGNGVVAIKSGSFDNSSAANNNLTLGQNASCSGTLNVEGGTFTVGGQIFLNYSESAVKSTINITGGMLTANKIALSNAGTDGGTITIDGGTLKANGNQTDFLRAHDNLHVYVGDAGATFDTGCCNITIAEDIEDKSGEAGVVTFTGGGLVTLSGTPTYTGGTTIEGGTSLSLTAAAKDAIFAHYVIVEIPSTGVADGTTVFQITDGGTFTLSDVEAIMVTATDVDRYLLALAAGDTKIVIVDTQAVEYMWNGGSSGANWSDEGKWLCDGAAATWAEGNIAVFANEGDCVTIDSDVTAASVTFYENATVAAGGGTITVPSVSVVSDVSATIDAPTAGTLEKTGEGTLTLGASRTGQTTLTEGTLTMYGSGTTLDWSKFTFGTDAAKTVTLQFTDGATLAGLPQDINFPQTENMTATIVKDSGDWNLTGKNFLLCGAAGTTAGFIQNGGTLVCGNYFVIGNDSSATSASMTINGGTVSVATDICLSRNPGVAGSSVTVKSGGTVGAGRVAVVGGVGAGEVALRREAGSCGKFLDAVLAVIYKALRLAHLDREDVLVHAHAERLANRVLQRRLRDACGGGKVSERDVPVEVVVYEREGFREPRRIDWIDIR